MWWILMTVFILRWFHLFSYRTNESALELSDLCEGEPPHQHAEQQAVYLSKTENLALES